jgi:hypothetical protein
MSVELEERRRAGSPPPPAMAAGSRQRIAPIRSPPREAQSHSRARPRARSTWADDGVAFHLRCRCDPSPPPAAVFVIEERLPTRARTGPSALARRLARALSAPFASGAEGSRTVTDRRGALLEIVHRIAALA